MAKCVRRNAPAREGRTLYGGLAYGKSEPKCNSIMAQVRPEPVSEYPLFNSDLIGLAPLPQLPRCLRPDWDVPIFTSLAVQMNDTVAQIFRAELQGL